MARQFFTPIDLTLNELQNVLIQSLPTHPTGFEGRIYKNSMDNNVYVYLDGSWETWINYAEKGAANGIATLNASSLVTQDPANATETPTASKIVKANVSGKISNGWLNTGSGNGLDADTVDGQHGSYYQNRDNHTGTQLSSTISDFDNQVRTNRLDQMSDPLGDVSLNGYKITNLGNPVNNTDAASKSYVDSVSQGIDPKQSVRAATVGNIPSLNGTMTIDGVSLSIGDRVLDKNSSAIQEISSIDLSSATPANLDGKYFTLSTPSTNYYVWFDVDNSSVDPAQSGTGIEVDIATGDSDAQISTKLQTVLNAHSSFDATVLSTVVTIDNVVAGNANNISAGNTGSVVNTLIEGKNEGVLNGIYLVSAGNWVRTLDTNTWNELVSAYVFVEEGDVNADTGWLCSVNQGGTLETDPVNWLQFSQAGTINAANVGGGEVELFKQKNGTNLEFRTLDDTSTINVTQTGDNITFDVIPGNIDINDIGGTPLSISNGGTGATTALDAKANLGFLSKYVADIGDGSTTVFNITHGLNSLDVIPVLRKNNSPKNIVDTDMTIVDVNNIQLVFTLAPSTNQFRLVVGS